LYRQRWLIISNALVDPREASEIAKHTGTTVATVHQVIASYNRLGVAAVETPGKGGRRRKSLSWEEEQDFLAPFFSRAERGEIATGGEIQQASARTGGPRGSQKHHLPAPETASLAQARSPPAPSQSQPRSASGV
jgi:transposase